MVTLASLLVALSFAVTFKMPLASMSNTTSICGMPRGAGMMPWRWNRPRLLLSEAISRSPCSTWISTCVWLSAAVENTSLLRVGMVVLRSMSLVATPPSVSTPSDSGEERQVDLGLAGVGELDLRLLGRLFEALQHHLVFRQIDAVVLFELGDQPLHDLLVDVVAAQVRVAVGGEHLDRTLAHVED